MSSEAIVLIHSNNQDSRLRMSIPIPPTSRLYWDDTEEFDPSLKTPESTSFVTHIDVASPFCTAHFHLRMNRLEWDTLEQELRELHQTLNGRVEFQLKDGHAKTQFRMYISINKLGHLLWQLEFSIAQEAGRRFQIDQETDQEALLRYQFVNDQTYLPSILTQMRHVSALIANPPTCHNLPTEQ